MFSAAGIAISTARRLITKTFTSNENWTVPAGVTKLETASGYGARGEDSYQTASTNWAKYKRSTLYAWDGSTVQTFYGVMESGPGSAPGSNYCDPMQFRDGDDTYYGSQDCYEYDTATTYTNHPATTGANTTGFGKNFPGSTGNVPQTTTSFTNVAVTPGAFMGATVPPGGILTITYYL